MKSILAIAAATVCWGAPPTAAPYDRTLSTYTGELLPRWLKLSGEFRTRVEGRTGFAFEPGNNDAYSLFRVRFNVALVPTTWLEVYFQGQDSRAPGLDAGRPLAIFKDPADVRQAYVRIGSGRIKLTVGRQLLNYGGQRVLGPLDWTNTSRNWDAAKLELGTADSKVDFFASSVVQTDANRWINQPRRGFNIHGAYGTFRKAVPHAILEPYLLWKTGNASIWTGGLRMSSLPADAKLRGFDYQVETMTQWGRFANLDHRGWAVSFLGGRTFSKHVTKPRVSVEYSAASGDSNPNDTVHRTFDHLLGTNHLFYGLVDAVGWQNMRNVRIGYDMKPTKRLQVIADYHWLWLGSASDGLYDVAGRMTVRPKAGNTARAIGTEIDFTAVWTVSPQWKAGGGLGHLFAGQFLKQNSGGSGQTFPYLFAQYSF
jgi:hypothetical protein